MQKMFSNRVLPEIDHRIYPLNGKANANDTCNAFCPTMQKTAYICIAKLGCVLDEVLKNGYFSTTHNIKHNIATTL